MNKFGLLAAALCVAVSASPVSAADDLVLGFATSTTGPYIANALTNQVAVGIAVGEINAAGGVNGHKLRIVQFDTAGDPKQAQVGLKQFAEDDGALGMVGPFASAECRVTMPAGERIGIPEITNGASAPGLTDGMKYAFRNTSDELTQFRRVLEGMKQKHLEIKSAAIIYATDEFISKSLGEQIFPAAFKAANIPVDVTVGFPLQAFDLAPQIAQLKAHPTDVVAVGGTVEAGTKIVREMRRQGIKSRLIGSGVLSDSELPQRMGPDGEGTLFATYFFPNLNKATSEFARKFAIESAKHNFSKLVPNHNDAAAYDNIYIFVEAMKRAKVTGDKSKLAAERTAIRDQLANMKMWNYHGLLGKNFFGDDGAAHMPTYVIEDNRNKLRVLTEIND